MTPLDLVAAVSKVDFATFWVCAILVVVGAAGVVVARNAVHAALMLVMTLFGVAVLFIEQEANFLAAVQVIVYAGAIVVLFLFVIMFLGVDRRENVAVEPLKGQRVIGPLLVAMGLAAVLLLGVGAHWAVGPHSVVGKARGQAGGDVAALGRAVFTVYLWPFEITAALLVIAVVGAVVLARRPRELGGQVASGEVVVGRGGDAPAGGPPAGDVGQPATTPAGDDVGEASGPGGPDDDAGTSSGTGTAAGDPVPAGEPTGGVPS